MSCSLCSCLNGSVNGTQSQDIDKRMKLAQKAEENTIRVLLLGAGSSGKTTIVKQIKKIHSNDEKAELFQRQKLTKFIKEAVIEYMKILCKQSVELHEKHGYQTSVNKDNEYLLHELLQIQFADELTDEIAHKIKILWSDCGIKRTLEKRSHYQIAENVEHFMNRIDAIASAEYFPSYEDYLRFRQMSTGFTQTTVSIQVSGFGLRPFQITDVGGQRSERAKWMRFMSEDVDAVLYVVAISDYDLTLFEDNKTNRLKESIDLFRNIMVKGDFFRDKTVLLFFNKYDLFKEKIKRTPITVAFDDYPADEMNAHNADDVVRFVASKFLGVFRESNIKLLGPLHIVRTTALDTNNMERIFGDITLDLVQENLKQVELL